MISRLDHIVYSLSASQFTDVIEQLVRAGFMEHTRQVRHSDGRISAFFRVSGGYLEFCSYSFAPEEDQPAGCCSIWLCSTDLMAAVESLPTSQRETLAVTTKAPLGDDEPAWLITNLPARCAGDAGVSLIEYLRGTGADLASRVSDNGLFAITAVSLRCDRPELDQRHYHASLGALTGTGGVDKGRFTIGHQWLAFMSRHAPRYRGPLDLSQASCLVHMATVDLNQTMSMLKAAGFILDEVAEVGLLAQSRLAPSFCLVLEANVDLEWHQARLLARSQ
ncbi:hypothetical protein [Stutzerimonas tarimensis]|uniref:Glyoxalase-like domain-containing protein n=1 Tax=Stutzerimonas tarimensis TaxID=1507735 RepID=A0ABV7T393_9GAMM